MKRLSFALRVAVELFADEDVFAAGDAVEVGIVVVEVWGGLGCE